MWLTEGEPDVVFLRLLSFGAIIVGAIVGTALLVFA